MQHMKLPEPKPKSKHNCTTGTLIHGAGESPDDGFDAVTQLRERPRVRLFDVRDQRANRSHRRRPLVVGVHVCIETLDPVLQMLRIRQQFWHHLQNTRQPTHTATVWISHVIPVSPCSTQELPPDHTGRNNGFSNYKEHCTMKIMSAMSLSAQLILSYCLR